MHLDQARARFAELRRQESGVSPDELDEIWAALPTVAAADVLGAWRGADFATGHRLSRQLVAARWHGKTFRSALDAKPLICRDESGELFSDVRLGGGEATLWNVEFRGEVTATMVYDGRPVLDHFKQVGPATLMGIMNGRPEQVLDDGRHYYFLLERD
ncbi:MULTISPECIES: DUF4334 domain-containing protein [unclassified Saccharopolyspora]|uniref:DUF4334 domain-containing protein n=1 Tax=unclassified Saccharopolyspora TaxID=2646250 RepID=UPI001CD75D54|nr:MULTISPECIES: DUF4334 domain-containing protein [unclassified Saccharopolyspora]MCA1185283.1 DUF4334 domain-containing protein [Saccharopolyspora sp. 6T]MCA1195086.1 DUF4334 domain-containing protein [Saccharopolyspora sp. 6V]MCA1224622.1 DUF4334 domain-containing protein [Saccharopolyspora sp. 6M]MCA1281853.1 DUF4334 domain-containing protein [Saccharopolyspora sp. 7B]